jgi:uncharacterized protein (TIGR03437 family)
MKQRTKKILWGTGGTFIALFPAMLLGHVEGPDVRHTGGPGDVPMSCGDPNGGGGATCHTSKPIPGPGGPINFYGGSVTATFSTGSVYVPGGQPITITVTVTDPSPTWSKYFGFQMSARLDSDQVNGQAGHFTATQPNTGVFCDTTDNFEPSKGCGTYTSGPAKGQPVVEFIEHAFPSMNSSAQTTPYTFQWTPPATNVGPVHFYVAGNAVNNNRQADGGDHVYTNSDVLMPSTGGGTPPTININGVTPIFGSAASIQPGSWIQIQGTNLITGSSPSNWNADFPQTLGGTSVSINGKPAYLWYASATQLNVEAPDDTSRGTVNVEVTTSSGSANSTVNLADAAPSFQWIDGNKHVLGVILRPNGNGAFGKGANSYDLLGPTGTSLGFPTVAAKAGDLVVLYGVGFGPTNPSVAAGQTNTIYPAASDSVTLTINETAVKPSFTGIWFTGAFQLNLTIPPGLPAGDQTLLATVNGIQSPQVLISLQ